ncbi:MAG: STAS domain-containing protein [Planctomycetota bacterium]
MNLAHRRIGDADVLVLPVHRLDADLVPAFKESYRALALGGGPLVIDLSEVGFIDSMGVGSLLGCMRRQHERGSTLRLCGVQSTVAATFSILKLSRVFEIYDTREDAVRDQPGD